MSGLKLRKNPVGLCHINTTELQPVVFDGSALTFIVILQGTSDYFIGKVRPLKVIMPYFSISSLVEFGVYLGEFWFDMSLVPLRLQCSSFGKRLRTYYRLCVPMKVS